jgi:hypothetical protein
MPVPLLDSSEIDNALTALLLADSTLMGMMPDGVYYDEANANANAQRFVLISVFSEHDVAPGRTFEDHLYFIRAVALSTTGGDVKGAAHRIDELLEDTHALVVPGYTLAKLHREERFRHTEVDSVNPDIRWLHRGGYYRLQMTS